MARAKAFALKVGKFSSCKIYMAFLTISSTSPTLLKKPVTPCTFSSGKPPVFDEITGTSQAMASRAAKPKLSFSEGIKNKSATDKTSSIASSFPTKRTSSPRFISRLSCSIGPRSGPSPTSNSLLGICVFSFAKTLIISSIRFTFRKLDVCTKSFSSFGQMMRLKCSLGCFLKRSKSTKFGITSISFLISNAS